MKKPKDISEYKEWVKDNLGTDFNDESSLNLYETNINSALSAIEEHIFFTNLSDKLLDWSNSYENTTGSILLMSQERLKLIQKSYESAINKSFRVNILQNKNFPKPPEKGWVVHKNLYTYFNDVIRGTIVCRFIDAPTFLTNELSNYARTLKLDTRYYSQEREEGYYAYHFYVFIPVKLLDESFRRVDSKIEVEIQITTQLQELLKSLTHKLYEVDRLATKKFDSKWKWEYKTNRFKVSYLSHTLHLLESVIVESRNSSKKKK